MLSLIAANDKSFSAKELEKYTGVSSKYLEKVLKILLGCGALVSQRGASGGYTLAKPAEEIQINNGVLEVGEEFRIEGPLFSYEEIKMGKVVRALEEDNMEIIGCVNKPGCCCPSSALWKKLFDGINAILDDVSLKDIVEGNL